MMSMMMSPVLSLPWMQCTSTGKFSGTVNTRRALAMSCLACRAVVWESHHWQCTCHAALQRAATPLGRALQGMPRRRQHQAAPVHNVADEILPEGVLNLKPRLLPEPELSVARVADPTTWAPRTANADQCMLSQRSLGVLTWSSSNRYSLA